ncbi:MAG TPA: DUF397 domain-containing protein [Pseudonocardiaceae bacterium]|nr:DUF397 domain-containing protein [Pseudonocardiaceae bacterium]
MRWRKSSRSGGNGGSCVEVAHTRHAVRDSKNPGPVLAVDVDALLAAIRTGRVG